MRSIFQSKRRRRSGWRVGGAVAVGLALVGLAISGCRENAIPKSQWLGGLSSLFAGAAVRANNYSATPVDGQPPESRFHLADDSALTLPSGASIAFDIPVTRREPYSLYVNDLRSNGIGVDAGGGRVTVRVTFESAGPEIVGNCVDNVACICGDPRIELDGGALDISFGIAAARGALVLDRIGATFGSGFSETGPCHENVCAFLCDVIRPDRESNARTAIETAARRFVDNNRSLIEAQLNTHVRGLGVTGRITYARVDRDGSLYLLTES